MPSPEIPSGIILPTEKDISKLIIPSADAVNTPENNTDILSLLYDAEMIIDGIRLWMNDQTITQEELDRRHKVLRDYETSWVIVSEAVRNKHLLNEISKNKKFKRA